MTDAKKAAKELIAENTRRFMADDMYFSMEGSVAKHLKPSPPAGAGNESVRTCRCAVRSAASDYGTRTAATLSMTWQSR